MMPAWPTIGRNSASAKSRHARLFDTNILLDVIENREGLVEASADVLERCDELQAETFIAWHGLATAYYILKRGRTFAEAMTEVDKILAWADIASHHPS
jgi:predicted nucleic acid-binding protein